MSAIAAPGSPPGVGAPGGDASVGTDVLGAMRASAVATGPATSPPATRPRVAAAMPSSNAPVRPDASGACAHAAAVAGRFSPIARLALSDVSASLSRTGVAASALGLAIAAMIGVTVPAFLTAMFGGVILTNLADLVRRPVDYELADLISTVALRLFLAMAMLSLKLWALLAFVGLLSAMLVAQVAVVVLVASLLVFPLMGRDRQAAIAAGGFIGFALGAMPVGLGTMRRLSESLGPAPHAFLVITLAASLFTDAANAIGITTLFALLE